MFSQLSPGMRILLLVAILLLVVLLLPLFIVNCYNYPTSDDFWYSAHVAKAGLWGAQVELYKDTSARLLSNFLMSLWPLQKGAVWVCRLNLFWLFPAFWLSLYALARTLNHYVTLRFPLGYSFMLAAVYFIALPGIYEGVYWTSGVVVYQLSLIFLIWWIKSLLRHQLKPANQNIVVSALLAACMLLLNEPIFLYLAASLFLLYYVYQASTRSRCIIWVNLGVIVLLLAFIFLSAGNWDKQDRLARANSFNIHYMLGNAFRDVGWLSLRTVINPITFCVLVIACHLHFFKVTRKPGRLLGVTVVFMGAFFASALPAIYAYGRPCPLRILNLGTFFLVPLGGMWLSLVYDGYLRKYFPILLPITGVAIIAYLFMAENNGVLAFKNLADRSIQNYNQEMKPRFVCLTDPAQQSCTFETLQYRPKHLLWNDWHLTEYVRKAVEDTYGKPVHMIRK